jgi:hypothetical protein
MDNAGIGGRLGRRPFRYSVAALLIVMTIVCVLVAILRPSRTYSVTAYLRVSQRPVASVTRFTPQAIERQAMNSLALVTSSEVIEAALASPGVANLQAVKQQADAAAWLADRLRVSFPGEGEILELRLEGEGSGAAEDQKLLNAVIDAYKSAMERAKQVAGPE